MCSHYKKVGHSVDKCNRIIGLPADFKFTKLKRFQGNTRSNAVFSTKGEQGHVSYHFDGGHTTCQLTQDQYTQLIHLFQQSKMNYTETSGSEAAANVVNCAGNTLNKSFCTLIFSNRKLEYWIQG